MTLTLFLFSNGSVHTAYVYLGKQLIASQKSSASIGQPMTHEPPTYHHADSLGSPVLETDSAPVPGVVHSNLYEPYGKSKRANGAAIDGPGYTGHIADGPTGLVYMQQRYYDPAVGRFLSVDPAGVYTSSAGNFNRYWYASSNPYGFVDPDGREIVSANSANNSFIERAINSVAVGTFKFDSNNSLQAVRLSGDATKFSKTFGDAINAAIKSNSTITIDVSGTAVEPTGNVVDVDADGGGGVTMSFTTGDSNVVVSGNPGTDVAGNIVNSAEGVLVHELAGHAIPNAVGGGTGNAIDNENIIRQETGRPPLPRDPTHDDF